MLPQLRPILDLSEVFLPLCQLCSAVSCFKTRCSHVKACFKGFFQGISPTGSRARMLPQTWLWSGL
jgi:hypothetical protein